MAITTTTPYKSGTLSSIGVGAGGANTRINTSGVTWATGDVGRHIYFYSGPAQWESREIVAQGVNYCDILFPFGTYPVNTPDGNEVPSSTPNTGNSFGVSYNLDQIDDGVTLIKVSNNIYRHVTGNAWTIGPNVLIHDINKSLVFDTTWIDLNGMLQLGNLDKFGNPIDFCNVTDLSDIFGGFSGGSNRVSTLFNVGSFRMFGGAFTVTGKQFLRLSRTTGTAEGTQVHGVNFNGPAGGRFDGTKSYFLKNTYSNLNTTVGPINPVNNIAMLKEITVNSGSQVIYHFWIQSGSITLPGLRFNPLAITDRLATLASNGNNHVLTLDDILIDDIQTLQDRGLDIFNQTAATPAPGNKVTLQNPITVRTQNETTGYRLRINNNADTEVYSELSDGDGNWDKASYEWGTVPIPTLGVYNLTTAILKAPYDCNARKYDRLTQTFDFNAREPSLVTVPDVVDNSIVETTEATVAAYTSLDSGDKLRDRIKLHHVTTAGFEDLAAGGGAISLNTSTNVADISSYNLTVNPAAGSTIAESSGTITINPSSIAKGSEYTNLVIPASKVFTMLGASTLDMNLQVVGSANIPSISNITGTLTLSGSSVLTINTAGGGLLPSGSSSASSKILVSSATTDDTFDATNFNFNASTVIENTSGNNIIITLSTGQTQPTKLETSGTITFDAPIVSQGITFTGLQTGSQVVVFDSGTTDILASTNTSGTSFAFSQTYTAPIEIDYTVMKAGFVPIRVTNVEIAAQEITAPVQQFIDRAYEASSGLTFGTTATVNTGTKKFDLTTASTLQNYYSFMIEAWIAESALRNVQFPIEPNGGNSFTLSLGWEFADVDAINFLSRDGMRYRDGSTVTAIWSALFSVGTATGFTGRYQQVVGAASTNANSTGVFDQLIQVFGDATHGDFDYRNYLVMKYQPNGFYQAHTDAISIYGTLADEPYVVALEPQAIPEFTTGDPLVTGVTITNHGASPVSWDAGNGDKDYSITVTDSGTNTSEAIMRWINYNLSLGGTFQGDEAFNYPDMIKTDGNNFETERGTFIGSAGATLKGIRVIRGSSTPHPDFTRFQSDDGTYGFAPQTQSVTVTNGVAGTRLQIYDVTSSTELYNDIPSSYPFTWNDSTAYVADREIRVRAMYQSGATAKLFVDTVIGTSTESAPALSLRLNQEDDAVYIANAINGSTVTGVTIDDTALLVEFDTGTISWTQIYAYETYWLATEEGIRDEGRFIEARDTANYTLYDFKIKNVTSPEVPLTITNGWGYDSVTNTTIELFDTTGGPIFAAPDRVVAFATGSGLSPGEQAQLTAIATDTPLIKNNTDLIPASL